MTENVNNDIINQPKGIGPKKKRYNRTVDDLILEQELKDVARKLDELKENKEKKYSGKRRIPYYKQSLQEEYEKVWKPTGDEYDFINEWDSWFPIEEYNEEIEYKEEGRVEFVKLLDKETECSKIKTMKFSFQPTKEQAIEIDKMFDLSRWGQNMALEIIRKEAVRLNKPLEKRRSISFIDVRNASTKYVYVNRDENDNKIEYREENKTIILPKWADGKIHTRIYRGAIMKVVQNVNSALTNFHRGYNDGFTMGFKCKKDPIQTVLFEDSNFPKIIMKVKSFYWLRNMNYNRKKIPFHKVINDILKKTEKMRGLELIREEQPNGTVKYFLHQPVPIDYFYTNDQRNESQKTLVEQKNRVVALDPGVRKFMVGYDSRGRVFKVADGGNIKIGKLLKKIDVEERKEVVDKQFVYMMWKKIKNQIIDLHWKTIDYLLENYDTILFPDFRISGMVTKSIPKQTKRMLYMYSFHAFKLRLIDKCSRYGKRLIIVDESYTSKTCSRCGCVNDIGSNETYSCGRCLNVIDRDVNGALNIYLKNKVY